jgi:hypothetical protein
LVRLRSYGTPHFADKHIYKLLQIQNDVVFQHTANRFKYYRASVKGPVHRSDECNKKRGNPVQIFQGLSFLHSKCLRFFIIIWTIQGTSSWGKIWFHNQHTCTTTCADFPFAGTR